MILLALAAAALTQWTGPHTEEYQGPGYFCGGGYRVSLARGDRALILPQERERQAARVILAGRNVSIWSGARPAAGRLVRRYGDAAVTEVADPDGPTTWSPTARISRFASPARHFTAINATPGSLPARTSPLARTNASNAWPRGAIRAPSHRETPATS